MLRSYPNDLVALLFLLTLSALFHSISREIPRRTNIATVVRKMSMFRFFANPVEQ